MTKNIVIFSDGTGKDGDKGFPSNIFKLYKYSKHDPSKQILFYDPGVGTDWRKITGSAFGNGISGKVKRCYKFIQNNYVSGDHLLLFGFSRGATTVRLLAGLIQNFGILPSENLVEDAYRIYMHRDRNRPEVAEERRKQAAQFIDRFGTTWSQIKFVGVWDTVGAIADSIRAVPWIGWNYFPQGHHHFQDLILPQCVENGRHALAIDDERYVFHPTVWYPEIVPHQTLEQVWFCGMHSDVGGGYKEDALSNIPLRWMAEEAKVYGLKIKYPPKFEEDPNGVMHDSMAKGLARYYRRHRRYWRGFDFSPPVVHHSVIQRSLSGYRPWILEGTYTSTLMS